MKRLAVWLALSLSACVPPSEERPPAGAGGFALEPSPGARGEPFAEDAGWMLTIEKLVMRVTVSVSSPDLRGYSPGYRSGSQRYALDSTKSASIYAPGASVGPARLSLGLEGVYIPSGHSRSSDDDTVVLGVAAEDLRRLIMHGDDDLRHDNGPSVLIRLRAQRDDRTLVLDLALNPRFNGPAIVAPDGTLITERRTNASIEIRKNALTLAPLVVSPEDIFDANFPFDRVAGADADGDDVISARELRAVPLLENVPPTQHGLPYNDWPYGNDLFHEISRRIATLLLHVPQ